MRDNARQVTPADARRRWLQGLHLPLSSTITDHQYGRISLDRARFRPSRRYETCKAVDAVFYWEPACVGQLGLISESVDVTLRC